MSLWNFNPTTNDLSQIIPEKRNLFWDTRISLTPEGKLFFSRREGKDVNIWTMNADGKNESRLIDEAEATSPPVVSPDGRFIVFGSKRSGNTIIWRADADGKNLKQLTESGINQGDFNPKITADGKNVIFSRQFTGERYESHIMTVPIEGGSVETVFVEENTRSYNPLPSPDGKRLAFYSFDVTAINKTIRIGSLKENKVEKIEKNLSADFVSTVSCSPDDKSLTYLRYDNTSGIWKMPVDGGEPELLADLKVGRIFNFARSHDGQKLLIVHGIINNDLVLIKDVSQ